MQGTLRVTARCRPHTQVTSFPPLRSFLCLKNVRPIEMIAQFSSELFSGYRVFIDVNTVHTSEDVIECVRADLRAFLMSRNLQLLAERLDETLFHMHDDVTDLGHDSLIYICDHDHGITEPVQTTQGP